MTPRTLTLEELADETGVPHELAAWLVERRQLRPLADGRFDARDAAIMTTMQALLDSGIERDALAWAIDTAGGGFASVAKLFSAPPERSSRTYRDVVAGLGPLGPRLASIYAALGLAEPDPDTRLRIDEEQVLTEYARLWAEVDPDGDADVRVARIAGESMRRISEGWLDVWDETARPQVQSQGAATRPGGKPPPDPADPAQNASLRGAEVGRQLVGWLHERALERTLNARIIAAFEQLLVHAGRLEARPDRPPAIAFVDLSGYTALTVERGDEAAAAAADRLRVLAEDAVRNVNGRLVKLLGDGVLLRFEDAASAIGATLDLVQQVGRADLPAAHAGIAAGRVVVRDGDVFGQTVNLAARIADHAGPGEVLVEEGVVVALPRGTARFEPLGRIELKGLSERVALWRAAKPSAASMADATEDPEQARR